MVQQPPGGYQPPPPPPGYQAPPPPPPGMPPQAPMRQPINTADLPIADFVVAGGALFSLIWTRLDWYKVNLGFFGSVTGTGNIQWGAFFFQLFLLLFAGFIIANHFLNFVDFPAPVGLIYLGMAGLSLLFVLLGLVVKPGGGGGGVGMNWVMWIIMIIFNGVAIGGAVMKVNASK